MEADPSIPGRGLGRTLGPVTLNLSLNTIRTFDEAPLQGLVDALEDGDLDQATFEQSAERLIDLRSRLSTRPRARLRVPSRLGYISRAGWRRAGSVRPSPEEPRADRQPGAALSPAPGDGAAVTRA